jgi:hypothetical protein
VNPLDPRGQLEVFADGDGAVVTLPLAEHEGDWISRYGLLARSEGLEARAEPRPGGAVLTIKVPTDTSREETFQLLDEAVGLVEKAKTDAASRRDAAAATDNHVREWWSDRNGSAP